MTLSKLESLPNEILLDLFENYIDGIDLLTVFLHQLNERFDALLSQTRIHFNFIGCHLDTFRYSLHLLPDYANRITKLALSERDTPGQVNMFFACFPSFAPFERLHSLYIYCSGQGINSKSVQTAILTLVDTKIETLTIKMIKGSYFPSWITVISTIFTFTTLRRLSLAFPQRYATWKAQLTTLLNIEHLTITGLQCDWNTLVSFSRYIPHLECLNIDVDDHFFSPLATHYQFLPMLKLRALSLYFCNGNTTGVLRHYFDYTPALYRLTVDGPDTFFEPEPWQTLIETSLPRLRHFTLTTSIVRTRHQLNIYPTNLLTLYNNPFWMTKLNFNIIVIDHEVQGHYENTVSDICDSGNDVFRADVSHRPVVQWWTAGKQNSHDHVYCLNTITRLCISSLPDSSSQQYYFKNVTFLALYNLNSRLVEWVLNCVNCSKIRELVISFSDKETKAINLLLQSTVNIQSLKIDFDHLIPDRGASIRRNIHLKRLDLSDGPHAFRKKDIVTIAQYFPFLEHLVINTVDLNNVPLLEDHLPKLSTLTFRLPERYFHILNYFTSLDSHFPPFILQQAENWIKIWLGDMAFHQVFWQRFTKI
ncbi:unnamed protein product [Adineta ricciae]|uniref:Uncharacterized protein n=1 Tax=Adineta ricciae TaxID=249248 RepID=A0A815JMD6_ADIRI|nr:unnamed protein product [Adineta ricciae]CAF1378562.1 unnamed protein product [Adineta ricciae]